jgi:hypothetical protein
LLSHGYVENVLPHTGRYVLQRVMSGLHWHFNNKLTAVNVGMRKVQGYEAAHIPHDSTKSMDSDLDKGFEQRQEACFISHGCHTLALMTDHCNHSVHPHWGIIIISNSSLQMASPKLHWILQVVRSLRHLISTSSHAAVFRRRLPSRWNSTLDW